MMREIDTYPPTSAGGHSGRRKNGARRKLLQLNRDPMIEQSWKMMSPAQTLLENLILDMVSLESSVYALLQTVVFRATSLHSNDL